MPTRCASLLAVLTAVMALGLVSVSAVAVSAGGKPVSHAAWTVLLGEYVTRGRDGVNRVDYRGMKARGEARLKTYIAMLESARPSAMSPLERKAYWINLYNAKTLNIVLSSYPVASIRDISYR
jgi:hypothetical protein